MAGHSDFLRPLRTGPAFARLVRPLLLLAALVPSATPASAGVRAPLDGIGDFRFLADLPTQPDPDGGSRVDLSVRIDHDELRPSGAPEQWQRRVSLSLKIAREGWVAVDTMQVFETRGGATPSDAVRIPFDLLEISTAVEPGRWAVTVTCVLLGSDSKTARATGVLEVAELERSGPQLGDPQFRVRSDRVSLPHPQRLYGVLQDTLEVYYEVVGAVPGERIGVQVEIRDPLHGAMDEELLWLDPDRAHRGFLYRLPLGSFPEGVYEFGLRLVHPVQATPRTVYADFVVSWRMERTLQGSDEVMTEAELLLPSDELDTFRRLSRVAQSQRMQEFWDALDPTPGTSVNELQELFEERVAHARRHYGEARVPGPLTARGRTYVRYGPPYEIDVEVLPASGADLDEAIERVHDSFNTPLEGTLAREHENKLRFVGLRRAVRVASDEVLRDRKRNQARVGQEGSFELWIYRGSGEPLLDEHLASGESLDLRFLFVDRQGVGHFELDYSNLPNRSE